MRRTGRVAAVVALQLVVLAAVPARQVLARARGREITLRTRPVDPFSPFGGYYLTLAYEAEFPGAKGLGFVPRAGELLYVTVEKGEPAWTLVGFSRTLPPAAPGRAVLRARWHGGRFADSVEPWMSADLESAGRFYLPEAKAKALEAAMAAEWKRVSELPWEQREGAQRTRMLVDLRADDAGNLALVRLRYGGLTFED